MIFPGSLSNIFPKKPNTVETRELTLYGVKLKVELARNDADEYKLTVYDMRRDISVRKHGTGRFTTKEVCEVSWDDMHQRFSSIFQ